MLPYFKKIVVLCAFFTPLHVMDAKAGENNKTDELENPAPALKEAQHSMPFSNLLSEGRGFFKKLTNNIDQHTIVSPVKANASLQELPPQQKSSEEKPTFIEKKLDLALNKAFNTAGINLKKQIESLPIVESVEKQLQASTVGVTMGMQFIKAIDMAFGEMNANLANCENKVRLSLNDTTERLTATMMNTANRKLRHTMNFTNGQIKKTVRSANQQLRQTVRFTDNKLKKTLGSANKQLRNTVRFTDNQIKMRIEASTEQLRDTVNFTENKITTMMNNTEKKIVNMGFKIGGIVLLTFTTALIIKYIYNYIQTPDLDIEKSENKILAFFKYRILGKKRHIETIDQLILQETTKKQVTDYRDMLFFAQKNKAPMTNVLLYGPPGTGKTEIGKRIAKESNATFIYFSGASLAAFKESEAIKKMKEMFEWAQKKGNVIIFIDEIETLLPSRLTNISEQRRNLLTEFLAYTGKRSDKFAIIGATNLPQAMDGAVAPRFDTAIKIGLPGPAERLKISELYQHKQQKAYPTLSISELFNDPLAQKDLMDLTDGLSGGEIESVWINTSLKALASSNCTITPASIKEEINNTLEKKNTIGQAFAA